MLQQKSSPVISILLALSLVLGACASLLSATDPECKPITLNEEPESPDVQINTGLGYIDGMVVLIGSNRMTDYEQAQLDYIVDAVNDSFDDMASLVERQKLAIVGDELLTYIEQYNSDEDNDPLGWDAVAYLAEAEVEYRLYQIEPADGYVGILPTVEDVIEQIHMIVIDEQLEDVIARPNSLLTMPVVGAPYDPSGPNPDPNGGKAALSVASADEALKAFENQWAFAQIGWEPGTGQRAGTQFYVFDTSPFQQSGSHTINWGSKAFTLCVSLPYAIPPGDNKVPHEYGDHGLFVAGLLHYLVPVSDIHLLQVMNDQGLGTYDHLVRLLAQLLNVKLIEGEGALPMHNAVINMSFGVVPLADDNVYEGNWPSGDRETCQLGEFICLFQAFQDAGAQVVAASGNDHDGEDGKQPPMQAPATYEQVIGVGGWDNSTNGVSCFSNAAQLFAPAGGDCYSDEDYESFDVYCQEIGNDYCQTISIIGPVSASSSKGGELGFAYWRGTSFSTPIVSALVAMIVEKYDQCKVPLTPEQILEFILGEGNGPGPINYAQALERVECPDPDAP